MAVQPGTGPAGVPDIAAVRAFLSSYDGPPVRLMEVCGTHTAEIVRSGIPSILSPKIMLISGPGCPVCVTVTAWIDRLVELSYTENTVVCAFGDLLRVPGSRISLAGARAAGGRVRMLYSPEEMPALAAADPGTTYVFAAVGFETTVPVYAAMLERAEALGVGNIRLLTSLRTMPAVIRTLLDSADPETPIDGFLAPGHVCAVDGFAAYEDIARQYGVPFVVSGFSAEQLLCSICALVCLRGKGEVRNFYPQAVRREGNAPIKALAARYFEPCDAAWRGLGTVPGSGLMLRAEHRHWDAGSADLTEDRPAPGCRCADVLTGRIRPQQCPLFGRACTPAAPRGACMVSQEGSCFNQYQAGGSR